MKLAALIITMLLLGLIACNKAPDDCKGEPILNCICPHVYDPVCGCDGVTYGNACESNCAGVKLYKEGACGLAKDKGLTAVSLCKGKPKPNCYCPQVYDPVCGCDGVTYGNACEANCAGVRSYTEGACGVDNTKSLTSASDCKGKPILICACPHVYDPVCGCDGVTYSNACFATCAGVKSYKEGSCDGSGILNR